MPLTGRFCIHVVRQFGGGHGREQRNALSFRPASFSEYHRVCFFGFFRICRPFLLNVPDLLRFWYDFGQIFDDAGMNVDLIWIKFDRAGMSVDLIWIKFDRTGINVDLIWIKFDRAGINVDQIWMKFDRAGIIV